MLDFFALKKRGCVTLAFSSFLLVEIRICEHNRKSERIAFDDKVRIIPVWCSERDLNHMVLHFLCGENAAVGSAAPGAIQAPIHYRLTLRVIRPSGS